MAPHGIHQEKGGQCVPRNMRSRMGDSHLGRMVLSSSYGKIHFLIKLIVLAGQPCRPDRVISTEWSFLSWVFSHPLVNIFSTRANAKLPLCVSPVLDSMGWEEDFFLFALLRRILLRILSSQNLSMILVASLWPHEGVVCQHSFSSGGWLSRETHAVELAHSASRSEASRVSGVALSSCLETIRWLIQTGRVCGIIEPLVVCGTPLIRESGPGSFIGIMRGTLLCYSLQGHFLAVTQFVLEP